MLTFNEERHEYRWGEQIVPSVTQVLGQLYDWSFVNPDVLERKRELGTAVHMAVQFDLNGTLDEGSIDAACVPYFEAWRKFRSEAGFSDADVGDVEARLYHPRMQYAGTPDLTVFIFDKWAVIDLKTAEALSPIWALQTAAYKELLNVNANGQHRIEKRYSLRLLSDGTYRLNEHKGVADMVTFQSALNLFRWKATNGIESR